MSIESRLNRIERELTSDGRDCPHALYVFYGDDGSGQRREEQPPEIPECWCGRPSNLLMVEYDSDYALNGNGQN